MAVCQKCNRGVATTCNTSCTLKGAPPDQPLISSMPGEMNRLRPMITLGTEIRRLQQL